MKKPIIVLMSMIFLLCGCFLTKGLAQSARIVNKDTYGAYTIEGMKKFISVIIDKDAEALSVLVFSGQIFSVKKGTRVFIEDTSFWDGLIKVRPQGQTRSIWIIMEDSDVEKDCNSETSFQSEPKKATDSTSNSSYKIEGIFYDKAKPVVLVGGATHFIGDSIAGAKIVGISQGSIIVEQEGKCKYLKIGDSF
jgi:hypothetical protein